MRALAVLVILPACGRISFDPLDAIDGAVPDSVAVGCWQSWHDGSVAFDPPRSLTELPMLTSVSDPSLAADGLTLYYGGVNGDVDVYSATRPAPRATWTPSTVLTELDTGQDENRFSVSGDGTIGVYSSDRAGTYDMWLVTRATASGPFGGFTTAPLLNINTAGREYDPELTLDALRLYYAPEVGAGIQEIRLATRTTTAQPFSTGVPVAELATGVTTADPTVSPDELVAVVSAAANLSCTPVTACFDLFYATRASTAAPFGPPTPVPGVNAIGQDDVDAELSPDGCELYFNSNRGGPRNLYVATVR